MPGSNPGASIFVEGCAEWLSRRFAKPLAFAPGWFDSSTFRHIRMVRPGLVRAPVLKTGRRFGVRVRLLHHPLFILEVEHPDRPALLLLLPLYGIGHDAKPGRDPARSDGAEALDGNAGALEIEGNSLVAGGRGAHAFTHSFPPLGGRP